MKIIICYKSCLTCSGEGNINNHHCLTCKPNHFLDQNNCIPDCDDSTSYYYLDENNNYQCTIPKKCHEDYPFLLEGTRQCIKLREEKMVTKLCPNSCLSGTMVILSFDECDCKPIYSFQSDIVEIINDPLYILDLSLEPTLFNIAEFSYVFYTDNIITDNAIKPSNISCIIPGELKKLRSQCNIANDEPIIVKKTDYKRVNSLSNEVKIQYFDKHGNIINCAECNLFTIDLLSPINNLVSSNYQKIAYMKTLGIDIENPEHGFFTDFCHPFEFWNKTDVIMKDRIINYMMNNGTFCPSDCFYKGLDDNTNEAKCSCDSKPVRSVNDFDAYKERHINELSDFNWMVLSCYKLVFNSVIFPKNFGSWVMMILTLCGIAGIVWLVHSARKEMFGYLKKNTKDGNEVQIEERCQTEGQMIYDVVDNTGTNKNKIEITEPNQQLEKPNEAQLPDIQLQPKDQCHLDIKPDPVKSNPNANMNQMTNDQYTDMKFDELIKNDTRTYCQHYWHFIKLTQQIINVFFITTPRTPMCIKVSLFIISLVLHHSLSAFFFSDYYISRKFYGKSNYFVNLPIAIYSYLVGLAIWILLNLLINGKEGIKKIEEENDKGKKTQMITSFMKCYTIRLGIYVLIKILMMLYFWYSVASFCAVYQNNQLEWRVSAFMSFFFGQVITFIISLIFAL